MIWLVWPVNLNFYYLLLISVLIMDLSSEQVIKYSFYIVIILYIWFECIYYLYISLKSSYTSYPCAYPPNNPTYNYDES